MFCRSLFLSLGLSAIFAVASAHAIDHPSDASWVTVEQQADTQNDIQLCNHFESGMYQEAADVPGCQSNCGTGSCCPPVESCCPQGGNCSDPCCLSCGGNSCDPLWSAWIWGGPSFMSTSHTSLFGVSEGINLGYRLSDTIGIYGSAGFNHNEITTQILGTVGIQKFGDPNATSTMDRTNIWIMWDQYTDTTGAGTYLNQLRVDVGFVGSGNRELGLSVGVPTSGDAGFGGGGAMLPMGGMGLLASGSSFVGPYYKTMLGENEVVTSLGYSEGASGVAAGAGIRRPISNNENVNLFFDAKGASGENWALNTGIEFGLGRADTRSY